ncbi:MAG: hypothetical protein ACREL7_11875 [Longimicrobiales bacterium]
MELSGRFGGWLLVRTLNRLDGMYKFIYLWLHFRARTGVESRYLGWRYVLPNPLFPFIAFRVAVPGNHSEIVAEVISREVGALAD